MEKKFLENLLKLGRIPGGLLFYGKEGSGKTYTAFEFTKGVLCLKGEVWGCNECPSCKHINNLKDKFFKGETENLKVYEEKDGKKQFVYLMGEHPDFIIVIPHGNYIKIDQIRKAKEFAYIRPALSRRKVILIDDAHTMTNQSSNALLKVLEEPPADTTFILTTSRKAAILPTILSRTFQVEFKGFTKEEVMRIANVNEEIAELSGGSLKKALLLKEKKNLIDKVKRFLENEPYEVYKIATEFENWEAEEKRLFLDLLETFLMKEPSEETAPILDKIRLMKEGIPRGINGTLWLIEVSSLMIA
ncbi:DNA polymerase III subunit [Aquifex sp.]